MSRGVSSFSLSVFQCKGRKEESGNGPLAVKLVSENMGTSYRDLDAGSTFYQYLIRLSVKRESCAIEYYTINITVHFFYFSLKEGWIGFSAANSACPMKKEYNTSVPIRRAMFCHLYKPISIKVFKGGYNYNRNGTVMQKDPLELSFSKITEKPIW